MKGVIKLRSNDCIFCKIANGEIPSKTLFENEKFRVIMDIRPATRGHILIIPKEHYADIYDIKESFLSEGFLLAGKLARQMTKALGCHGFNIVQNNGKAAGQTVFHFHIHLIPRYEEDGVSLGWKDKEITDKELDELLQVITSEVKEK